MVAIGSVQHPVGLSLGGQVESLTDLPADARERLLALTPGGYTGLAADLARKS